MTRGMDPARRRMLIGAIVAAAGLATIGVVAAVMSGVGGTADATDAGVTTAVAPLDAQDESAELLARAREMSAAGNDDGALRILDAGRRVYPDRPAIPYEMGRIYFARLWWNDGIKAFRNAIRADAALRSDPDLIKTVLRGFILTPDTDAGLAGFLREDIGAAAIPYLEETAQSHPSPKVRARAAALLQRMR